MNLDALLSAVEAEQTAERGVAAWLRSRSTPARWGVAVAVLALVLVGVALAMLRINIGLYPRLRLGAEIAALLGLAGSATWLALWPMHRRPLGALALLAIAAGLLLPIGLALAPAANVPHPASFEGLGDSFVPRAMACLIFGVVVGLPLLIVLRLAARIGASKAGQSTRVALGAVAASALGVAALVLHCPITQPGHLLAGHAPVALVLISFAVGFGWLWGRRGA